MYINSRPPNQNPGRIGGFSGGERGKPESEWWFPGEEGRAPNPGRSGGVLEGREENPGRSDGLLQGREQ